MSEEKEEYKTETANSQSKFERGVKCPACDGKLITRDGKYGLFYGCTKYPKCKYTEPVDHEDTGEHDDWGDRD